jgi:SNF2 family DNA or RNA helicase
MNPPAPTFRPTTNGARQPAPVEVSFASASDTNLYALGGGRRLPSYPLQHRGPAPPQSAQNNGVGSFVERQNNVLDRSDVRQPKRRKTVAEGDNITDPNNSVFQMGGGGVLGEYVKDQQQSQQNTPMGGVETVDLTDADEDVVMLQKPADPVRDEEVCIGMIHGALINCHKVPAPKPGMISIGGDNWWPQVKVVLKRIERQPGNKIFVYDHTRDVFGLVDPQTSAGLVPVLDSSGLQVRTDCRIPPRRKLPDEQEGQPISRQYKIELVVYCRRKFARQIGRHFTNNGLVLGTPTRVDAGVRVFNPHSAEALAQPVQRHGNGSEGYSGHAPAPVVRTAEEVRSEVLGMFDSLRKSEDLPQMDADDCVVTPLLKHQKQALWFMTHREEGPSGSSDENAIISSSWQRKQGAGGRYYYHNVITNETLALPPPPTKGGILADMMGLGKTLSVLSLITKTRDSAREWESSPPTQPKPLDRKQGHNKAFELPKAQGLGLTNLRLNAKATLLICPLSTISNWEEQIKQHFKPGSVNYHIYHGQNRIRDPKELAKFDLVVTTYGSVSSELNARAKGRKALCPLEEVGWFRIVLDEAHMIREQNTLQFKAVCRLQADRRWAVTGTPVQNRLDDLAALLAFLRLKPFDDKSKFVTHIVVPFKNADPEIVPKLRVLVDTITIRRLKDKIDLPPRTDEIVRLDFTPDEKRVYDLFAQNAQDRVKVLTGHGREKILGGKTYIHILQSILRLRLICAHGKDLLNEDDLRLLQGMSADSPIDLDSDDDDDKPALQEAKAYELLDLFKDTNQDNCIKCGRKFGTNDASEIESERQDDVLGYMTPCPHIYCKDCVSSFRDDATGATYDSRQYGACPMCGLHIKFECVELRAARADLQHEAHHLAKVSAKGAGGKVLSLEGYTVPHTKTRALLQDLIAAKKKSAENPTEPPYKSVVFSGWTTHLDLIQMALQKNGITFTRLDGKMTRTARTAALDAFRDDWKVQVILVSITAGGVGLNLTTANSVYVMEPQFNPAAEAQAIDRVHRLGQKREVRTVRYIMRDSFEEKMLELQDKKMKLASLSMDNSDKTQVMDRTEAARNRLMEIRSLFR